MKLRLPLIVAAAVCALTVGTVLGEPSGATASAAATKTFAYDPVLATIARESLWKAGLQDSRITRADVLPVWVRCYRSNEAFADVYERRFGRSASNALAYYAGGADIHLRPAICARVHALVRGDVTELTAGAFGVLLHESLHRQGLSSERVTSCFADDAVLWGMRWLGFDDAVAVKGRNLAFAFTRRSTPSSYRFGRKSCLAVTSRVGWFSLTG